MSVALPERVAALREALDAADGRLSDEALGDTRALLAKIGARTALGDATVVALAGPTGSGKSTLFNALAGAAISRPGVLRPTTSTTHAMVWDEDPAATTSLLDWLGVMSRHYQDVGDERLQGLVLLDLPDHDSTAVSHRLQVDRLVGLVDLLVWVLDPQKYADASVHEEYLRPYTEHQGVLLVVLNQVDRLDEAARRACLDHLRALLDDEGLTAVPVLAVSAGTGLGIDYLRAELSRRVSARRSAAERLAADVRIVARELAPYCAGQGSRDVSSAYRTALTDALADGAGVAVVSRAVERSVSARGAAATGWPPVRWLGGLRADPLRRLHLTGDPEERTRTSLPPPTHVQEAAIRSALRRVRDDASDDLPEAWRDDLRRRIQAREPALPEQLDRAVAGTELDVHRGVAWWGAVAALQRILLLATLTGALWLLGLMVLGYLQLAGIVPLPRVEGIPVPTLLMLVGLLAGLLLSTLSRPLVQVAARRRGSAASRLLRERVQQVADEQVLTTITEQHLAYRRFCGALARARA